MKAIILAAGRGSRLAPLTNTIPKSMISIIGKPILEHLIESIYDNVDEIFIVVKYLKETIEETFGDKYKKTKITYIIQGEKDGTGGAIMDFKVNDDIIILYGDSIYNKKDIKNIIESKHYCGLVKKVENPSKFGIFKVDDKGNAIEVIEKPKTNVGNLANMGCYKFSKDIFDYVKKIKLSERKEYELTDAINLFIKDNKFKLIELEHKIMDITYPWDILSVNSHYLSKLKKSDIKGEIEDGVIIKGNVILGKGSIIKSGTYIEGNIYIGENTEIGPGAHLRGDVVIGNNCVIGHAEIKDCSIGNGTKCKHFSYLGYSIIGNNINIGAGYITADLRHDKKNIRVMIKGELIDSGRYKLGIIMGDNVCTGINSMSYPGRIIENGGTTLPGEIIK